jgi:hypothetical protein
MTKKEIEDRKVAHNLIRLNKLKEQLKQKQHQIDFFKDEKEIATENERKKKEKEKATEKKAKENKANNKNKPELQRINSKNENKDYKEALFQ